MFKISNESVYFVISSSESLDKHLSLLRGMGYKCKDVFNVTGFLSSLIVNPNGDMYTGMGDGGLQRMTESELINKHNLFKKQTSNKTNDDITKALDKLNKSLIDKKTVLFIHEVRDVFHITGYDLEYHDGSFYISLRGYTEENGSIRLFAKDYAKSILKYVKIETKTLTGLFT